MNYHPIHGVILNECIQRYCETFKIAKPEANIEKFLKKWTAHYIIYLTETPTTNQDNCQSKFKLTSTGATATLSSNLEEDETAAFPIRDIELAILFHFFSIHGKCI